MSNLQSWLSSMEYLPKQMRDFHDQKDLFKSMHFLYQVDEESDPVPFWTKGHVYVIDWFLWFMASRGYTLQKTRKKNVDFLDWPNHRELIKESSS